MNESFRQITIHPALPCVYHGCKGQATDAIVYEVSEREWRNVIRVRAIFHNEKKEAV